MDRKLEARVARLERLVYNRSVTNEILGLSKNEKEANLAAKAFSHVGLIIPELNRASENGGNGNHYVQRKGGSIVFQWDFYINSDSGKKGFNDATVGLLNRLLTEVATTTKSAKPDFSPLKYSKNTYKDGDMCLRVTIPDITMEDLDKADHYVKFLCWFNKDSSRSSEDIFEVELYVHDVELFKKYFGKYKKINDYVNKVIG